jgi:hypothetical protein
MRESNYWFRLIAELSDDIHIANELNSLIDESNQSKKILGSIAVKSRNKD